MTSCVDLVLAGALALGGGDSVSTAAPFAAIQVPSALAARVGAEIAERWSVDAATLTVTWETTPRVLPEDDVVFRLAGNAPDGRFAVVLRPDAVDAEAVRVHAGVIDTIAVASRPLATGARLAPGDWTFEPRVVWGPPRRHPTRPADGWEVRRPTLKGETLTWPAVAAPPLVVPGARLRLIWKRGDVSITSTGTALGAAGLGESFRARLDSGARVIAIARAAGEATLAEGDAR